MLYNVRQRWPTVDPVDSSQMLGPSRPVVGSIAAAVFFLGGGGLCQNVFSAPVPPTALRLAAFFESNYLCEEALSRMKIIKSRYRSHLTDKRCKYCQHLCLSNYEPSLSVSYRKILSVMHQLTVERLMKSAF